MSVIDLEFRQDYINSTIDRDTPWFAHAIERGYLDIGTRVRVRHTDETGEIQYAVEPADDPGFWLDAFPTEQLAVEFAQKMGFEIVGPRHDRH